ncbi:MAG: DUF4280 domain-containing protein [Prevotellaceae bacterium]|nr:DUF4280 domain-containing protein [Prevotellaceae bacterium]
MGKNKIFVVEGATCMCQFGASPGKLCIKNNSFVYLNGGSAMATDAEIANPFQPPGFGSCNATGQSKPCNPAVTKWTNAHEGVLLLRGAKPLTAESKAICSLAGSECITIKMEGQIEIAGAVQAKEADAEHQGDLDPVGESPCAALPDTFRLRI